MFDLLIKDIVKVSYTASAGDSPEAPGDTTLVGRASFVNISVCQGLDKVPRFDYLIGKQFPIA